MKDKIEIFHTETDCNQTPFLVRERAVDCRSMVINNAEDIRNACQSTFRLAFQAEEHLVMLALNAQGAIIAAFEISHGNMTSTICDMRSIMRPLLLIGAEGFLLVHNHPSGNNKPSPEDIDVTRRVKQAAELMQFRFHGGFIITRDGLDVRVNNILDCRVI